MFFVRGGYNSSAVNGCAGTVRIINNKDTDTYTEDQGTLQKAIFILPLKEGWVILSSNVAIYLETESEAIIQTMQFFDFRVHLLPMFSLPFTVVIIQSNVRICKSLASEMTNNSRYYRLRAILDVT